MDVMNSPAKSKANFKDLLSAVRRDCPDIRFKASDMFRWSDENQTIYYDRNSEYPLWSLLHELGHMHCGHSIYNSDASLVRMELEAWESAKEFGEKYNILIDEDHIQDCMDSYRAWRHKRSTCPTCAQTGIEKRDGQYGCMNCRATWQVGTDRFCRVYRRTSDSKKPQ